MTMTVEQRLDVARRTILGLGLVLDTIEKAVQQAHTVMDGVNRELEELDGAGE